MSREELLNMSEYWQEMAENECWREGINCKIQLIDGNKQWHNVADGLPPKPNEDSIFSDTVLITDGESVNVGFCSYVSKSWYNSSNHNLIYKITHWSELPQLPKKEEQKDLTSKISDADKVVNSLWDKNKVCAVLKSMISEITYEDLQGSTTEHYDKTEFIEDFCKAMEGMYNHTQTL